MSEGTFRLIEHTADIGVEAEGATLEEAFAAAARGMFAVLVEPDAVEPRERWTVEVQAADLPLLLWAFLDELLYLHDTRQVLVGEVEEISVQPPQGSEPARLHAVVRGEPVDPSRHSLQAEIKAVTLHGLAVEPFPGGWRARVIFDL